MTKKLLETFLKPNKGTFSVPVFLLNLKDSEALGLLSVLLYPPQHGRSLHSTIETISITALVFDKPRLHISLHLSFPLSSISPSPACPSSPNCDTSSGFRPVSLSVLSRLGPRLSLARA